MDELNRQVLLQQERRPRPFLRRTVVLSSALILFSLLVATNLAMTFQSQFQIGRLKAELQSLEGRLLKSQTQFDIDEVEKEFEEVDDFFPFQDVTQGVFHLTGRLPNPSINDGCQKMKTNGNNLRLPPKLNDTVGKYDDYIIKCWKPALWVKTYSSPSDYEFDENSGRITVKNAGLYYVYSQLFYVNHFNYDQSYGHGIFLNNATKPIFRCTVQVEATGVASSPDGLMYESCYTGGVEYLMGGDSMSVQNTVKNANLDVSVSQSLSYWGIFKVQTVRAKKGGNRRSKTPKPQKNRKRSNETP